MTMRSSSFLRYLVPPGSIKALTLYGLFFALVLPVLFYLDPPESFVSVAAFIILGLWLGPLAIMSSCHPEWRIPWWLVVSSDVLHWSPEERWARKAILLMSMPFALLIVVVAGYVLVKFGGNPHSGPLMVFVFALPAAIYLGRRACQWLWPETMKRADANAATRRGLASP